jgi:ABC-type multidrug transport system ATPase subunit
MIFMQQKQNTKRKRRKKMSRIFKIEPFWHDDYYKIYNKESVEIKPGVTNLLACNGGGKTTLIQQIIMLH